MNWITSIEKASDFIFPILSIVLMGIGVFLFLSVHAVSWISLFLGSLSLFLHSVLILLERFQHFSLQQISLYIGTLFFSVFGMIILLMPKLFNIFSKSEYRLWLRAARYPVHVEGKLIYHVQEAFGTIIDISRTGCSFIVNKKIPLGEKIQFFISSKEVLQFIIIKEIPINYNDITKILPRLTNEAESYYSYGAKIIKRTKGSKSYFVSSNQ